MVDPRDMLVVPGGGAPTYPLVVRFTEAARLDFAQRARRSNKVRAWGAFGLGIVGIPLVMILPGIVFVSVAAEPHQYALAWGWLACGVAGSGWEVWHGIQLLKRRPELPEVAVTITEDDVSFGGIPRLAPVQPRLDAAAWPRVETRAELTKPTSLLPALVAFRRDGEPKRRVRSLPADSVDVDAATIIAAIEVGPDASADHIRA